jgi:hypothetical protein
LAAERPSAQLAGRSVVLMRLSALTVGPFQLAWGPRQFEVASADAGMSSGARFFYLILGLVGGAPMMVAVIEPVVRLMAAPPSMVRPISCR